LRLANLNTTAMSARIFEWTTRLTDADVPALPAQDLYAGEHWDVARRIPSCIGTLDIRLWVCSAGYGLIPADAPIRPYSATFSPGHADSVAGGRHGAEHWWAGLIEWPGPVAAPRTLAQLVASDPRARVLAVLSGSYVGACRRDLIAAASSGNLSVASAGARQAKDLEGFVLPIDGRLQALVGGTRQSLNARVVAHLLGAGVVDHDDMHERLITILKAQPPIRRYNRRQMSDDDVRSFIRRHRSEDPSVTHSRLLRQLRTSGFACEQSRFARLFRLEKDD
jgi:hypothetical protein